VGGAGGRSSPRTAIRTFLGTQKPAPRIDVSVGPDKRSGLVAPSFDRGAVLLVAEDRDIDPPRLRLVWREEDARRALPVPPGKYRIFNYVIERTHEGADWILSGSSSRGPSLTVETGEETPLAIDDRVHVGFSASATRSGISAQMMVSGHAGMGLSVLNSGISETDRRPAPEYALFAGEREIARGILSYG